MPDLKPADHSLRAHRAGARVTSRSTPLVLLAAASLAESKPALADEQPPPKPPDSVFWLWALDGRFEVSKKPCATTASKTNPAQRTIIDFIGSETYVNLTDGKVSLTRGSTPGRRDEPAKHLLGRNDEPIGAWYRSTRTWLVQLSPRVSPAFAVVTLVIETNESREGSPKCYERWIAPVSP
jgi:hypothetical protein